MPDAYAIGGPGAPDREDEIVLVAAEEVERTLNRFDLGCDGSSPPKLFGFNGDTPTALIEVAVAQWSWKKEVLPHLDQFNSLHDKLVAKRRDIAPFLPPGVLFAHVADDAGEDTVTASYLRDTAEAAGIETAGIVIDVLCWDAEARRFVDFADQTVEAIFKLYPWEWLVNEEFAGPPLESLPQTTWIEPIWKTLWSDKAILAVLWQLFPGHPNLLPASFAISDGDAVAKPLLSREGANVSIRWAGQVIASTAGDYGGGLRLPVALPAPRTGPRLPSRDRQLSLRRRARRHGHSRGRPHRGRHRPLRPARDLMVSHPGHSTPPAVEGIRQTFYRRSVVRQAS